MRKNAVVLLVSVGCSFLLVATPRAQDAKFAADNLKFSRDFYSKVHFVAIANLSLGSAGTAEFKYDRYPNGGPERIQCGDGEFARKNGKTWLKSNDWGETGKPVDAQTAKRLNNWIGLINARLNGEPASNDPSEGATVMKFLGKEDQGERQEFVFEESKEKPKAKSYPHISLGRFKNAKDEQVLLSHFSGPMRLGAREAKVDIDFSHLVAVQIKDETNAAESPTPSPAEKPRSGGLESAAAAQSPASGAEESSADLVNRGIEKAKKGDLDGAIADLDRAAELDRKNDAPYYNRAQAKRLKKDTAGAIADYTKAIELGSTNPAAYNNRGNARVENKDRDGAIADYTRAIELKPDYARAYYNRAVLKKEKGDKAGAAADFKRARQLDPHLVSEESSADPIDHGIAKGNEKESPASAGTVEDFFNRAGAKKAVGDLDGAIADYDRAIQLDPKDAAIYNNRGLAKQEKGDLDAAIVDFNRAIQLNPKDAVACGNRGSAKRDKGDLDGAILDYNRGIELNPKYASAYYNRAYAKQTKGDIDGAVADYTRAIELNPKDPVAYNDRGVARQREDDFHGAIADFNHAIKLNPKYAAAYANRGNAKAQYDDWDGAIADLDRAIKLDSKAAVAYYERAYARRQKKDAAGALADYTRAIELDGKDADFYKERGDVWIEKKQY